MRILAIAAAAMLFAGAAFAQSAIEKPGQPGAGFKSPEATTTNQTTSQLPSRDTGPMQPGTGYQIPETKQQGAAPTTSGLETPGQPGSGYRIPESK